MKTNHVNTVRLQMISNRYMSENLINYPSVVIIDEDAADNTVEVTDVKLE